MVTIVALKFAMSSHFPLPKKFALFVPTLKWRHDRRPKTNARIHACPELLIVRPIENINQTKTKIIGNKNIKIKKEIVREA